MGTHGEIVDEIIRIEPLEHVDIDDSGDEEELIPEAIDSGCSSSNSSDSE